VNYQRLSLALSRPLLFPFLFTLGYAGTEGAHPNYGERHHIRPQDDNPELGTCLSGGGMWPSQLPFGKRPVSDAMDIPFFSFFFQLGSDFRAAFCTKRTWSRCLGHPYGTFLSFFHIYYHYFFLLLAGLRSLSQSPYQEILEWTSQQPLPSSS
jgi:hypothetical protein